MFCSHCSAEVVSSGAKFCYSCGRELTRDLDVQSDCKKPKTAPPATLSFEDLRKGHNRCSKVKPKANNSKATKQPKIDDLEVTIQIGVMFWKEDSSLSTKRGCNLPLKIHSSATAYILKAKAVSKQNRFNSGLVKSSDPIGYKLLYPDKTEMNRNFAWNIDFSLRKYKELGKPYSRIVFYVCSSISAVAKGCGLGGGMLKAELPSKNNLICRLFFQSAKYLLISTLCEFMVVSCIYRTES